MPSTRNTPLMRYGLSVLLVAAATLGTLLIWPLVKPLGSPLYLVAVVVCAWRGGKWPGLLATILSGLAIDLIFVPPQLQLSGGRDDLSRLFVFGLEGFTLSWLIDSRKQVEDEVRVSREQLRALSAHLQSRIEEERTHIAREVHDELGQALTGLKYDLFWLRGQLADGRDEESRRAMSEKLGAALRSIDEIIQTVRRIATELRPAVLDTLGLAAAIEWQATDFERRTGIKCRLSSKLEEITLDPERATAVFRVFQEGLTNIARHAEATRVEIAMGQSETELTLRIEDNGKGIEEGRVSAAKSLGILGMRERIRLLEGELQVRGEPGKGTTLTVRIPLRRTERERVS